LIGLFDRLSRPFLRALDPEDAHRLAIKALRIMPIAKAPADGDELAVRAFGLKFPNPIGLAAGFDKNAEVPDALLRLGFGFVEVGTVTPRPQSGNPRPRLFRLESDQAVINRLGFNNEGAAAVHMRLAARRGVSPNTPGLRDLQQANALDDLLARVIDARERTRSRTGPTPILLKIAPDLTLSELDDVVGIARKRRVDGMIVGNTTITRPGSLRDRSKTREQGGLSGRPLFKLSTRMLAETFVRAEGAFPVVGVGGIDSGATAIAKIKAGATLLQLYSALVYHGIGLVSEIKADLTAALKRGHRNSLASMVGSDAAAITAESWPG